MKRRAFGLVLGAGVAMAQQQVITIDKRISAPGGKEPTVLFFTTNDRTLKGAPYSAERTTETIQVLADGNRITNSNKSSVARDGEGRTRLETQIQHFGPVGAAPEAAVSTFINDPVAKASYTLDSKNKIAYKSTWGEGMVQATSPTGTVRFKSRAQAGEVVQEDVIIERREGLPAPVSITGAMGQGVTIARTATIARHGGEGQGEDLGERNFEGVVAKGKKHVMRIAAGSIGNERDLEIVTETWFSEQLKEVVYTRHADPRFGETITKLSNIRLGEPPASLFEVPPDYKLESAQNMRMPARTIVRE